MNYKKAQKKDTSEYEKTLFARDALRIGKDVKHRHKPCPQHQRNYASMLA